MFFRDMIDPAFRSNSVSTSIFFLRSYSLDYIVAVYENTPLLYYTLLGIVVAIGVMFP